MKALTITGGGARGISVGGVLHAGARMKRFYPGSFDVITGDSFGALVAALVANGWSSSRIINLFAETDMDKLLTRIPWKYRKPLILLKAVKLKRVSKFIDNIRPKLRSSNRLFINTWDSHANEQVIYCEEKPEWAVDKPNVPVRWEEDAFNRLGFGKVITRSMALPGLEADDPRYLDGGVSEHPPMSFIPRNTPVLLINLGFAGLVVTSGSNVPDSIVDRVQESFDVKAHLYLEKMKNEFHNLYELNPKMYDVSATKFDLSKSRRLGIMRLAEQRTKPRWEDMPEIYVN